MLEQFHHPERRAGGKDGVARHKPADIVEMKAVHILVRRYPVQDFPNVELRRQRQLHQNAVHLRIGVEPVDQIQHLGR